ncbi:MAG: membrane protein insertion efficiency factor YidD [Kofleriaceae bacterium]|nr:membrane protein insertion efficiency factor YidD [Kofleriaceae bacterium]MCL4227104.1 membrane protein insertion efficiency factor YidD [Myxococcales bacterium]
MLRELVLAPIRLYRRVLSGLKPVPTCRYLPTCSAYAVEAIETRGVVVGGLKALWRIARCNPLFHGGHDPVDHRDRGRLDAEPVALDLARDRQS